MLRTLCALLALSTVASDITLTFGAAALGGSELLGLSVPTANVLGPTLVAVKAFLAPSTVATAAATSSAAVSIPVLAATSSVAASSASIPVLAATSTVTASGAAGSTGMIPYILGGAATLTKGAVTVVFSKVVVAGVVIAGTAYVVGPRIIDDQNAYLCTGNGAPTLLESLSFIPVVHISFCSYAFSTMHILHGSAQYSTKIEGESRDGIEAEITFTMTLSSDNIKAHALQLYKKYHSTDNLYEDMFRPIAKHAARIYFQDHDIQDIKGDLTDKMFSSLSTDLKKTSYELVHLSVIGGYRKSSSLRG
jgi:hypothetical protein